MHLAGQLVQVVAASAQQGYQFFQLRQIQLHHIAVHSHFSQIGAQVFCSKLRHFLLNQLHFISGYPKQNRHIPLALGAAHRSGSCFFGAAGLRAGGSCLSFCRTELFCCSCMFFLACLVNRSIRPGLTPSTTR